MACPHKFQSYLNLEHIDFEPTTLIVGTFNPAWLEGNDAEWFYGRTGDADNIATGNNFWNVLPRLYGQECLKQGELAEWKGFCKDKNIAITDLISCIDDADVELPHHVAALDGYDDQAIVENFEQFQFVNIITLLQRNPTITNVYLTRGVGATFWRRLWRPVKSYCIANGKRPRTLITPSRYAYFQQGKHNNLHPENPLNLQDYILMRWQAEWHEIQPFAL